MNSDQTDLNRTLLVKAKVYLLSVGPACSAHNKPWRRSGHYAKKVNFKSIMIGYLAKVVMIRHTTQLVGNCLLSSYYPEFCAWL